jgi:mRNA interferase YafQ
MDVVRSGRFKKDIARLQKRGKDMEKMKAALGLLLSGAPLPPRMKDHALIGNWAPRRDLHIEPDWLLIYMIQDGVLWLERTGTHSDLFR